MNIKTLSLSAVLVLAVSGGAFAQGFGNSGSGTPSNAGAVYGHSHNTRYLNRDASIGAVYGSEGFNNDNGTMSGDLGASVSGVPNNTGAVSTRNYR